MDTTKKSQKKVLAKKMQLIDDPSQFCAHYANSLVKTSNLVDFCLAPEYTNNPQITDKPFITTNNASLPIYPASLQEALDFYCVGKLERIPNIDINLVRQCVNSVRDAHNILTKAQKNKDTYWAAFAAKDIVNPSWWPEGEGVPGYSQLIVGSGPTDIGIHQDVYGPSKFPVDTYFTICTGAKQVIMLPPSNNIFGPNEKFPMQPDKDILEKIVNAGGNYFEIRPISEDEHITLFVPKGWYHWLLGRTDWAVLFGSSRF